MIDQIHSILQSKNIKNIGKKAIKRGTGNRVMAFRDNNIVKKNANNYKEYYNNHKLGYFGKNYSLPNKQLNQTI